MTLFRALLIAMLASVLIYTGVVAAEHGVDFVSPFLGAIAATGWQGQFNLDFMLMLVLTGIWVAWRGGFAPRAIALGMAGALFGTLFLASFLLILSLRAGGDPRRMLLGVHADR